MNSNSEKDWEVSIPCSTAVHTTGYCEPERWNRAQHVSKSLKETAVYNLLRRAESLRHVSRSQESPRILCNPEVNRRVHNTQLQIPVMDQLTPVCALFLQNFQVTEGNHSAAQGLNPTVPITINQKQ